MNNLIRNSLVLLATATLCAPVLAQDAVDTMRGQLSGVQPGQGLDKAGDDRLMEELANRGLENLLNRAFDVNKVSEDKRNEIITLLALRELSNPDRPLSAKARKEKVAKVVKGIEDALPKLSDPKILMQQAATLIIHGVERDVNTLEYWGENTSTQASLRPVVESVLTILDKAAVEAGKKADELANKITHPNDPAADEYLRMEDFKTNALYTRHMVDYYLALATDKADPNRNKVIDAAIEFLKQYDTPDTQVQPLVRTRIGKMLVLKGDYEEAKKLLDSIGAAAEEIQPRPDVGQQFEARYFSVLADLAQQEWEAVDKGIKDLTEWSKANIKDENAHKGATAAISMLQYRHASAQAKAATDDDAKAAAQKQAVGVLLVLVKERPELQGIIYEQLMGQLPENPEYKTLDPLLLQALIRKGEQERLKSEDDPADPKTIERGIAAAQEFVSRKGQSGIDPESVETAALLIGLFHEKVGNKIAAGNAFLDYVEQFPSNPKNAQFALDYAMAQIAQLRQEKATDETYWKLYDRFLPVAIGKPFNRTEFAFEYAQRLQKVGEFENASQYYGMVPATDARALAARYFQLLALKQRLEDDTKKLESDARQKLLANMQKLADDVNKAAADALAGGDEKQQAQAKSMIVRTALLAADVARREQKDPQRVLQLLQGFEESVKGMPKENELLAEALSLRVNSYMAVGENSKATEALVALLNKTGGREGSGIVYRLLEKLEDDLSKARNAGDKEQIRQIARNRSELSTFLVSWAREHKDESIKRFYYRYSVFDAASKKLAADLEPGPEARRAGRETALKLYQALQQPDAVRQYRATLEGTETDPNYPDPQVTLGMGLIQYDLQNYQEAQKALGKLLGDRKLGTPTMITERDGQEVVVDNDQYWEATLKLMRSNIALAEKDAGNVQAQAGLEETKNALKRNYITWGARVGGKKFKDEYETLRKEMIPDFDWTKFATPDPAAATQPVAGTP